MIQVHNHLGTLQGLKEQVYSLADPQKVKDIALSNQTEQVYWNDLSFSSGYSGIVLLFSELDRQFPNEEWDKIVHQYVLKIKKALETDYFSLNGSLFEGLAGVCFSLKCASRKGNRYQKMIQKLDDLLVETVYNQFILPLKKNLDQKLPSNPFLYDAIMGISGVCQYTFNCVDYEKMRILTQDMLHLLIQLTQSINIKGYNVPGWYFSKKDQFNEFEKTKYPNGTFNLGLSHGVIGILATLSIALLKGIEVSNQRGAIEIIANWLIQKRGEDKDYIFWDSAISFEDEVKGFSSKNSTRAAWCYGIPGIARTLFLASLALERPTWRILSLKAFKGIFNRKEKEWDISSPTFCHGLSGLSLLTYLMSKDASTSLDRQFFISQHMRLNQKILDCFDSNSFLGFQDVKLGQNNQLVKLNKPGLLEGAVGVYLTLLTPYLKQPKWPISFLVSKSGI